MIMTDPCGETAQRNSSECVIMQVDAAIAIGSSSLGTIIKSNHHKPRDIASMDNGAIGRSCRGAVPRIAFNAFMIVALVS